MKIGLDKHMEFKLTCVCCGSHEFEVKKITINKS